MTARWLPASAIHVGDVVRIGGDDRTVTHVTPHAPEPGRVLITDSAARAWSCGASMRVQVISL